MTKKITGLCILLFSAIFIYAQDISLKKGMVIRKSSSIKKAIYQFNGYDSLNRAVVIIEGNNIIVDFKNATLSGSNQFSKPDQFSGVAVIVRNGKNITIRNLNASRYKIALIARNIEGLKIENCNFSYNYRKQLNSTQEKEDISDWMSYHQNEKDEWLRYGAAIYLRGCNKSVIRNTKVSGGQNALMMMECNNGLIYNNDFSFNSGIGLGMYKSSGNKVMHNRINFNVRGYSHGVYNRGQDSAGILVYEQSNSNLFFRNSVTHGGDGFFLWAGQTTMDTGAGGCNDNQLIENDFSYAPTNGVEVTFSRNTIVRNRIFECDHGIWGGYSYETVIAENKFSNNRIAIAIEHGQKNYIKDNLFSKDKEAIKLWARKEQPADWGYAKYRDTRSANYTISTNSFNNNPLVYNISATDSLRLYNNAYHNIETIFKIDSAVKNIDSSEAADLVDSNAVDYSLKDAIDPFKGNGKIAGRKNIMITEWGPYDFNYPIIWNINPISTSDTLFFTVITPKGKWRVLPPRGFQKLIVTSATSMYAIKPKTQILNLEIVAEFIGESFIDQFGNRVAANKPYRFSFKKFFQPIDFSVSWYAFDSTNNPINSNYLERIKTQRPFKTESVNKLDYAWWGGIKAGTEIYPQFLTIAEGNAEVVEGNYELGITWDDAVRVYVDGDLLVDEWNPSKYRFDESPHKKIPLKLTTGVHVFRVEHVELGGFATLALKLNRK